MESYLSLGGVSTAAHLGRQGAGVRLPAGDCAGKLSSVHGLLHSVLMHVVSAQGTTEISGETAAAAPGLAEPTQQHPTADARVPGQRLLMLGICAVAIGGAVAASALYLRSTKATATLPGLRLCGQPLSDVPRAQLAARVHAITERFLDQPVRLVAGDEVTRATLRDLGLTLDEARMADEALRRGHTGDPLSDLLAGWRARHGGLTLQPTVQVNTGKAVDFLTELKDQVDRSATDAHLDLEHHAIAPERTGYLLRVFDSLVSVEYAARALSAGNQVGELRLAVAETRPQVRAEDLRDIDVSTVLGTWETHYSSTGIDSDRAYNLKVGADKLNGHIIKPGATFSFNEVVGNRTEREGYRVAPVISGGELVDGLAGGMCQIASTLHAAAFFSGLEVVRATPHSRPSAYIPMGLDSTVVWPSVDLKLKNPYDFPLVLHYMVNQGTVKVELLGKARPYKVAYEREIVLESSFGVQSRPDPTLPLGQKIVEQEGYPGYRLKRRRYLYTGKWQVKDNVAAPQGLVAVKEWDLGYPATSQIVRVGTGPASLKKREAPPSHHIPPVSPSDKPFFYILR